MDIDSDRKCIAYKHQISKAVNLDFDVDFDALDLQDTSGHSDSLNVTIKLPNPGPNQHDEVETNASVNQDPLFAKPKFASLSTAQVDAIADARLSSNTMEQTRWGVKIIFTDQQIFIIYLMLKLNGFSHIDAFSLYYKQYIMYNTFHRVYRSHNVMIVELQTTGKHISMFTNKP